MKQRHRSGDHILLRRGIRIGHIALIHVAAKVVIQDDPCTLCTPGHPQEQRWYRVVEDTGSDDPTAHHRECSGKADRWISVEFAPDNYKEYTSRPRCRFERPGEQSRAQGDERKRIVAGRTTGSGSIHAVAAKATTGEAPCSE